MPGLIVRGVLVALGAVVAAAMPLHALAQERSPAAQPEVRSENRDDYMRRNEGRFEEWGRKIDDFNAKAAERGHEVKERTKRELDEAWSDVKAGWSTLKGASKESWDDAKDALEAGWRRLERVWSDADS